MIVDPIKTTIETSGVLDEKFFGVGDLGMIFDILRNKMYSNPIQAIAREISCNARDAHREVGKEKDPIQITLPNSLEPSFRIKDWGPGISPKRMNEIFLYYASSTKRNTNSQTGFFGLGSKTPYSYVDQYSIETIVDGIKYTYSCVIDETKVGKLILLSEIPTDELNSTEIIIPVKPNDFYLFREATEFVTRHFTPRPIIKGDRFEYQEVSFGINGEGWGITKYDSTNYYSRGAVKLIIDGIEYPLDINQLKSYSDTSILSGVYGTIYLYFNTGEISLSASREQVHLDKRTQDAISDKLSLVADNIKDSVKKQINEKTNLWEANLFFTNEICRTYNDTKFLGSLEWNGIRLTNSNLTLNYDAKIYEFYRGGRRRSNPDKIYRSSTYYITFKAETALCLNDLDMEDPNTKTVAQAFDDNPSLKTLQLVCLNKGGKTWEELNQTYHLDQMNPLKLSDLTTSASKKKKKGGVRFLVFKFNTAYTCFRQVPYSEAEEDPNPKVLCFLEKDEWTQQRRIRLVSGSTLTTPPSFAVLKGILAGNPDVSIYGVDHTVPKDKVSENFPDCKTIEEFVDETVLKNQSIDYMEVKYARQNHYAFQRDSGFAPLDQLRPLIKSPKSLYLRYMELGDRLNSLYTEQKAALSLYEEIKQSITNEEVEQWLKDNPEKDFLALQQQVHQRYPLLLCIDPYYSQDLLEPITHYINLTDREFKNKKV
jgi:hypothetical protein